MIGVRRKRNQYAARIRDIEEKLATQVNPNPRLEEQLTEARYEWNKHQDTITVNLVKNKRPPARLVDDLDWFIDPSTGRISPLDDGEFAPTYDPQEAF